MKNEITLQTRREFLRRTVLGSALTWTVPAFLADTFSALQTQAASATQAVTGKDSTILIVLQMAGGNDGLNTVVPYANDFYHRARPRIGLKPEDVLKLNDSVGLHGALKGFKELYDGGQLSVIQGVGYPNPNRSHFRSTEIWQTASDSDQVEKYGWLGRYFDNACAGADPAVGVTIGSQLPEAFFAAKPKGICFSNPQNYRFLANGNATEESYKKLNELEMSGPGLTPDDGSGDMVNSGGSIGMLPAGMPMTGGRAIDFISRTALDAQHSSDEIRGVAARVQNQAVYPNSPLAGSLKLVAKLIGGGLPTRVYYVSQGGYDTHTNQVATQQRLLQDLGDSVKAFVDDMKAQGNLQRVLVMTFSEFGRRVAENANGGTDHGAAAPMFIIGNQVKAGLLGRYPSLAPQDLFQGDVKYNVDFRSVYAGVLENWLRTKSVPILGKQFPLLPVV
jgi:uncharacterized protein (DUF1501 family)